jgi:RND family efflux transporter MFP subunit
MRDKVPGNNKDKPLPRIGTYLAGTAILLLCIFSSLSAGEGMPPASVVVKEAGTGMIAPESEFIGTVFFSEVSDVAAEVDGSVSEVRFEEGQRVNKEDLLVKLGSDLLAKRLESAASSYEEILSQQEKAQKDLERAEKLFSEDLLSEQAHDEYVFSLQGLAKKSASLKAEVELLEVELQKKEIRAPFSGVVISKHVERGEWVSPGTAVATIGGDEFVDIIAEVPEGIIGFIRKDMPVTVLVGGGNVTGIVSAIIPRGDISTRTFPVKIRARNSVSLREGMEARINLPAGEKQQTLTVPRDAVIPMFGMTVVFVVTDSKAKMIPVEVVGYEGLSAGVSAEGLSDGMRVVVKGNERLRDGQEVIIK